MDLLPVYITADTIEGLHMPLTEGGIHNIEETRDAYELAELLKHSACVIIDKDISEIDLAELYRSNPLLAHLISGGNGRKRIEFQPEEHKRIRVGGLAGVAAHPSTQYFSKELSKEETARMENVSGMLHHSLKTSNKSLGRIFRTHIEYFRKNRIASYDTILSRLLPHHSIAIIDPYLLRWDNAHLLKFLTHAKPKGLHYYYITLIFSPDTVPNKQMDPEKWITARIDYLRKELYQKFGKGNIRLEHLVVKNDEFHDRMILTNNQTIFQGYGMSTMNQDGEGKKLTTWIYVSHAKTEVAEQGHAGCHFLNIRDITDAIKEWRKNAEPYSSKELKNPILG